MLNKINQHLATYYDEVHIEKRNNKVVIIVRGTPVHSTFNELSAHSWIYHHVKARRRTVKELVHCLLELGMIEIPVMDYDEDSDLYRDLIAKTLMQQGVNYRYFFNPETQEHVFRLT